MEPYTPEFRRALKEAHPGLRDIDIDRLQELTTRRATMRDEPDANAMASFDHQIDELLRNKMPEFDNVARQQAAIQHAEAGSRISSKVEIRLKREH